MSAVRVASLFAGCGGSSLGYRAAGLRVVWANEWDAAARETYELNAPRGFRVDARDVRKVRGADIPEVDVLDGSPPCQPFTTANHSRSGRGDKRDMFPEYVRLVGEVRPRAFVCENVPGLNTGRHRPYLLSILADLEATGYAVRARVLEAEWHGVPQTRHRLLIVGLRADLGLDPGHIFPTPLHTRAAIRDALPDAERIARVPRNGAAPNIRYLSPMSWPADGPAPTVMATGVRDAGPEVFRVDRGGRRGPIRVEDALRLQTFPDGFRFPEDVDDAVRWKMVGNAVPPVLAEAWGRALRRALGRVSSAA